MMMAFLMTGYLLLLGSVIDVEERGEKDAGNNNDNFINLSF